MKNSARIRYQEALDALTTVFENRRSRGPIDSASQDYFYGCCDRWSMAIEELSRSPGNNRILDIGAHEGFLCEALVRLGYSAAALDFESHLEKSLWEESGIEWRQCHIEGDPIPFPDEHFGAVYMGQLLEHLTYSPKKPF
jgi:2-polyprenyl-3-methyl-5-hydroxy-6-metoxy-1,4-benzoquinol methylase